MKNPRPNPQPKWLRKFPVVFYQKEGKSKFEHVTLIAVENPPSKKDNDFVLSVAARACRNLGVPGLPFLLKFKFTTLETSEHMLKKNLKRAAQANCFGQVEIDKLAWRDASPRTRRHVLVHEIAHVAEALFTSRQSDHGPGFTRFVRRAGIKPNRMDRRY